MFICAECGKKVSQRHFNNLIIMPFLKSLILKKKVGGGLVLKKIMSQRIYCFIARKIYSNLFVNSAI